MNRFTSRKFIIALIAQIAGLVALIWPGHSEGIGAAADAIAAMLVMLLSGLGYITAEASIDRARARDDAQPIKTQTPEH